MKTAGYYFLHGSCVFIWLRLLFNELVVAQQPQQKRRHETLHTKNGKYDDSWLPVRFQSEDELKEAVQSKMFLVAHLNQGCSESFQPIFLRNVQRSIHARFMGIATMLVEDTEPCKLTLYDLGGEEAFNQSDITDWESIRQKIPDFVRETLGVDSYRVLNNLSDRTIRVYWVDPQEGGKDDFVNSIREHHVAHLGPDKFTDIGTYIGHLFVAIDAETGEILDFAHCTKKHDDSFIVGERKLIIASVTKNFLDPHILDQQSPHEEDVEEILREHVYDSSMELRMALSDTQVYNVPKITDMGYEKSQLAPELVKMITEFYFSSYNTTATRIEKFGGPLYNQRVIPTYHTPLPFNLKATVFEELRKRMEEWSGLSPLQGTSIYGVRTYTRGSYLHMHVDTANTHVVSGIIHIHRQNLEEPWPLEILDHDGNLQYVNMEVGDFVFYESAKLLHGRPHPLIGDTYANVFVHYQPASGWNLEF